MATNVLIREKEWRFQPQRIVTPDYKGLARDASLILNPAVGPVDLANPNRIWALANNTNLVVGKDGQAYNFDGVADRLTYTGYPEISGNVCTWAIWMPRVGASDTFGHVHIADAVNGYAQITNTGAAYMNGTGSSSGTISGWFNTTNRSLVLTSDGTASGTKLYIDGVVTGVAWTSIPTALSTSSKALAIGSFTGGASWDVDGSILCFAFLKRAWGGAEAKLFHESRGNALYKARNRFLFFSSGGFSDAVTETSGVSESTSAIVVYAASQTETSAASEAQSSILSTYSDITETSASSESSDSVITNTGEITETSAISESQSAIGSMVASQAESIAISATESAVYTTESMITETAAASESSDWVSGTFADITETSSATEINSASSVMAADITEIAAITDISLATFVVLVITEESISVVDTTAGGIILSASVSEAASIIESANGAIVVLSTSILFGEPIVMYLYNRPIEMSLYNQSIEIKQ